ncbi:MAG: hypothetical protein ACI81L_001723 [Verrucomicrobiales bacterium]|jgi:hypothetical protein
MWFGRGAKGNLMLTTSRRRARWRHLWVAFALISSSVVGFAAPSGAQVVQQLKMPFPAGDVRINFDETYAGSTSHPTNGAIAFDMARWPHDPNAQVLAIGDGEVRWACTHNSGSAILVFRADGYAGEFFYVHLNGATLPAWIDGTWRRVVQGEPLGALFPDTINGQQGDACPQFSTGSHLHLDLPTLGIELDGVAFDEAFPNDGDFVTSTNRPPGQPASAQCGGLEATIIGTTGNDTLVGTPGADVIAGLQGNDSISGLGGDDVMCGGIGNDVLVGGQGFDVLYGAQGNDELIAGDGSSVALRQDSAGGRYFGGKGDDVIHGSSRWDRMQGGPGRDSLYGYEGRDWMRGGADSDRIEGGNNVDNMHGGNGPDRIIAGGGDIVRGGASPNDVCDFTAARPDFVLSCEIEIV